MCFAAVFAAQHADWSAVLLERRMWPGKKDVGTAGIPDVFDEESERDITTCF